MRKRVTCLVCKKRRKGVGRSNVCKECYSATLLCVTCDRETYAKNLNSRGECKACCSSYRFESYVADDSFDRLGAMCGQRTSIIGTSRPSRAMQSAFDSDY